MIPSGMRSKNGLVLLLLICAGCYSPITNLDGYIPDKEITEFPTVDSVLTHYLTTEAYQAVKEIPAVEGFSPSAYAAGSSRWSSIASWISGSGTGRKVVFSKKALHKGGYASIIHEYVHHLDDMTRDDPEIHRWVSREVFMQAYRMLNSDHIYKGIVAWCESRANAWITNTFGIGEAAEHIAYIAMFIVSRNKLGAPKKTPEYLKAVFGRILNIPYQKTSIYVTMTGEVFSVTASPDKIELVKIK